MKAKKMVFSGMRPTGQLHLGNYLGAFKAWLTLQEKKEYDCIYCVVDLHGITTPYNVQEYPSLVQETVLHYLAVGLDPKKCHIFLQSQVPYHLELAYLFGTIYPVSRLEDLPTYKEKKAAHPTYVNMGLLYYPVLMAADILLYKAEVVPVGKDQLPHIEVTREIARKFNRMFGQTFPEPKAYLVSGAYVPSLTGTGKMSKTDPKSYIALTDDYQTIKAKLAKVPTDLGRGAQVPQTGGVAVLLRLVELFEGIDRRREYEKQYLGKGIRYSELKDELASAIYQELAPIQERYRYYKAHSQIVTQVLEAGREYCLKIAKTTIKEVRQKMGLTFGH